MHVVSKTACPNCGAPLALKDGQRHAICVFCSTSLQIHMHRPGPEASPGTAPRPQLMAEKVSKEDVERLKQLVLAGKRGEAIAHYEKSAGVARVEAEEAVNAMMLPSLWAHMRNLPLNAFGVTLHGTMILGGSALTAWAASEALEASGYFAIVALGALFVAWRLVSFFRKMISTWVASFGSEGRARILKRTVLTTELRGSAAEGAFLVVLFEVAPIDGSAPFVDQEPLMVRKSSVDKLAPGNIVPVRFDGRRTRVFPVTPIQVLPS